MHFYFVLMIAGCLPYVNLALDTEGSTKSFDSYTKALAWAKKNCAWECKIIKW